MYGIDFFTYIYKLNRSSDIKYLLAERPHESCARSEAPLLKKIGNLCIRENLFMTSAYARNTIGTDAEGRGKKTQ